MNLFNVEVGAVFVIAGLLIAFAIRYHRRLQLGEDFILGRRRLGAWHGAIGIAMNAVPVWWLVVLVALAYATGRAAVWSALGMLGGVLVSGWSMALRLRARSQLQRFGTISELLSGDTGAKMHAMLMRSAVLIAGVVLVLTAAAQLQLVAGFLSDTLATSRFAVMSIVGFVLCLSLSLSGLWIALIGDLLQYILFIAVGVICAAAMVFADGLSAFTASWSSSDWFDGQRGLLTISFLVGSAFLIGDIMGQPSLAMRFMACKDDADLTGARKKAVLLVAAAEFTALLVGWFARAANGSNPPSISGFVDTLSQAMSAEITSTLGLLTLAALGIGIGNGLLVTASHLANDLRRSGSQLSLLRCRVCLLLTVLLVVGLALYMPSVGPEQNFDRMLFSWHAAGAAFGPLLVVRLTGKRVRPGSTLGAMWSGFLLTVVFHLMPDTPGDLLERSLPFTAALGIALSGGERRRNPDRADRGDRTIHDRLPI
jgi:sodium/proline symporter